MTVTTNAVLVGDRIRFSVPLIRQMIEEPDGTALLMLKAIQLELDGSKVLVLSPIASATQV